ncbi:glycosyltransferase family 4 protein [Neolewinella aurantiaca]|uniref:Glycosyltransferase family 4 protein n=1 Tax=Neolewinella aurantiaca TaxID=2602767 RepID=A0A5C7F7S0_9BACT|nr:glycosyltransferase family 4 protein [Neolewinella aurantiaca]TXF85448.1 glycosyltransferase family 4 protein [Neolewinella aurantiaca]
MNILFVLEHYPPYIGGAETLFGMLAEQLADKGHRVRVITTRFRPDLPVREVRSGVSIQRINCGNRFLFSALAFPAAWRSARWADVIHTTTYNAAPPAWLAARLSGTRAVITFHEFWGDLWLQLPFLSRFQAWAFRVFERFVLNLPFDSYVAVSDFTARTLVQNGVKKEKVIRIYNGLNYDDFTGMEHRPKPGFHYTFFGRLGVSKGLDLLLPAAAELKKTHPQARLRLIIPRRPAAMLARINGMLDELNIRDVTEIHHELSDEDLRELLLTSSCVVIPSYSEGFCFAAAETVAMGIPVISSGRGALVETVGGQFLEMEEMSTVSLARLLRRAAAGDYDTKPIIRYTLRNSIAHYTNFYDQ